MTTPPVPQSHDPPRRQFDHPQLVQDELSSITEVADGGITKPTTQSARRITAQYDMKIMYKYVVNKLAPYWVTVADMLEYSVADRNCFRRDDNRSSLVAMLENWIITDNGREPKTWPTFMKVLKEVDEDQSISVGHDICVKLEKDGVLSSNTPVMQQRSTRPSSYAAPSLQDGYSKVYKSSYSCPAGNEPVSISGRRQSNDDIKKKLVYENVPEENSEQSSKAIPGRSYGTPHRGQSCASFATKLPPPGLPGLHHPPSYRPITPSQRYQSKFPSQDHRSVNSSQENQLRASLQDRQSIAPLQNHRSLAPFQDHRSIAPSQDHRSMAPLQDHRSMAPSQDHQSMAFSQDHRSMAPFQDHRSIAPSQDHRSMAPLQDHRSMAPSQDHQSMAFSQDHRSMAPFQDHRSIAPSQDHRSMAPLQDHRSMAPSQDHQSMAPSQDHRSMAPFQDHRSIAPSQDHQSMAPLQDHRSMAPSQDHQSMAPLQDHRSKAPSQDHQSMAPSQDHRSMAPFQGHQSVASSQDHRLMNRSQDYQSRVPLQDHRSKTSLQGYESVNPSQSFLPMQGHPSMPHLQHMPYSQPGGSYTYHSLRHQTYQPRPIHPRSRQRTMQQQPSEPQFDNTGATVATVISTVAMSAVTSSTAVITTTASSDVTSSTASNATSTGNASSHSSSTTTGKYFCVQFIQSCVTTKSDLQPTNVKSSVKSFDNVDSSSSGNNLSVANDEIAPLINVNPPTVQTATNSNVAQVSSHNQSTLHATLSPNVEVPIVPAPFKWTKGRILGSGAFGRVFLCTDEDNNRILAVKEVDIDPNLTKDAKKAVESLEKEIKILKNVKHDRIVQYYGTQRNKECVCIFMEYMKGGSLYHYIDKMGALKEYVASDYTRQLLEGVEYLHVKEIIHRDIKGANILMDHNRNIKIADFGASKLLRSLYLSVKIQENKTAIQCSSNQTKKSVAGTAYWMAPEVIRGETVDHGADIWSVGCTVVEMLTCHPPYTHLETFAAMYKIATEPMCYNIPEESSKHVHHFLSQCFKSKISERPAASTLLKHQFVRRSMCSDDVAADGGTPAAFSMASSDQQQQQAAGSRNIDSVSTVVPQSETDMDTLIPAMPDTTPSFTGSSSIATNDIQSGYPTSQRTILTATPSQVGLASDADTTSSSALVTGVAASSDQSSSPAGNDDDDDDTPDDDDDALGDNNFDGDDISKAKAEQCSTSKDTTTVEPQSETADGVASTATNTDCTTAATTADADRRDGFGGPQVQQTTAESSYTSDSYSARAGYASNINNNSTPLKSLPVKPTEPSNECMQDPAWKIKHQEMQNGFISNIFCNFPQQSEVLDTLAGGHTVQVVQFIVHGNNMVPATALSSLPIFDTHNSLEPFAQEICSSVNIQAILPWMIKCGLLTRYDQEYFMSPSPIPMDKRHRLMYLVISLNEKCVEKFLDCLSQTAVDYAPHDYLLKKIQSGRVKP